MWSNSRVDDQVDFFGKKIGNFADQVSAKNIDQRVASRGAENEARRAECGGDVDNGCRSGFAYGIAKKRRLITGFLLCSGKNFGGFRIFLPLALAVLLGHEALLTHKKKIKPASGFARFA